MRPVFPQPPLLCLPILLAGMYTEGQVVEFETLISAFHKGRFMWRVCKINGLDNASEKQQLTEQCLNEWILVRGLSAGLSLSGGQVHLS